MVILKNIKIENVSKTSSDLLVIGRFKSDNIKSLIASLSDKDKNNVSDAISLDLSDGDAGQYLMVSGLDSYKRIMVYNLGDKDKITNDNKNCLSDF